MKIEQYPPLSIQEIGQRPNQEDSVAEWSNRLFVLCDGMGGHEKGEVASQTVCQSLVKWFEANIKDDSFTDNQLREAIEYAYQQLDQYADGSPKQMGTTLTLLYIGTRDHSLAFDLFQSGEITFEEMKNFKQKNIVTRAMTPGEDNRMRADIIHITDVQPGDYFYLCSDGMLEQMSNDELVGILSSKDSDAEKQSLLIKATSDNQDNHTAWIIQIKDVIKEEGDEALKNEEPTARCNAINIIPKVIAANEDDVVIVEEVKKTKTLLQKMKEVVDFIMNKK